MPELFSPELTSEEQKLIVDPNENVFLAGQTFLSAG